MQEFLKKFEEYCRTPGIDSNKARSYAKAIEYLCDYLQIDVVNEQTILLFKDFQNNINDKSSSGYENALQFFAKRGQKSYLENGFVKAALKYFFKFINEYNNGNIKSSFLKFLGPVDSLNGYQKSYKLVLYKVMFDLMNDAGECSSVDVAKAFRQFYVDRVNAGKVADVDVDKRIEFIRESSIKDIYNVITANPFKVISEKGFIFRTNEPFEQEKICFNVDLIDQISDSDLYEIGYIIDKKLELYFSEIDDVIGPKKTWLLAWNPNNWDWEDFDEAVELVRNGENYEMGWSCTSKQVNPGDRVFLTVLGIGENNGIIASGTAISGTYESEHWDDVKRERGQTTTHIDVRFDCIRDYENESYLMQTKLKALFPEQQWSPMGSGISIKDIYCENLENEWQNTTDNFWWPSLSEYNPGITKEKWLELLNNSTVFTESALKMMADFYVFGGTATCIQLAERYNKTYNYYLMTSVHLAERVVKATGCPTITDEKMAQNSKWWPVLYIGRDADKQEKGSFVWKIRDELYDALTEFGIEKYLSDDTNKGGEKMASVLENIIKALESIGGKGTYSQIYEAYENVTGIVLTDGKKAGIRGTIERNSSDSDVFNGNDVFYSVEGKGRGIWGLRNYSSVSNMTTKQKIEAIKNYIAAKGFNYEGNLIENFYLSLKSKPFVILAGTSGTGKTRLVKLFAEAIGAEYNLVSVRPDWSDSSDLFGHTNLSGKFQPGAIIGFIKKAEWDKDTPYFLCLDEMNLARVEYYLSDFLSKIETRDRKENGDIETEPLVDVDYYKDKEAAAKYGRVFIPDNLYIIGTVNMDETTFPFSKKVLDRANTIEFSYVNLLSKPVESYAEPIVLNEDNDFLKTEYLYLRDCDDSDVVDSVCFDLEELNSILVKANLHVGYRVRDEISFYMMNNKNADLLSKEAAFDNEIMQKILPRIQGSSRAIKDVLSEMFIKCAGDYTGLAGATDFEQMTAYIDSEKTCKYPNSAKKIAFMMRRYEEDGFTSYWL